MTQETANHPSRADRQKCWKVRDAYFECLDEAKVLDPFAPAAANICQNLKEQYEKGCMKSWVIFPCRNPWKNNPWRNCTFVFVVFATKFFMSY